jgi:RNA polymerase sigma-70 factor (ECF subfamily)
VDQFTSLLEQETPRIRRYAIVLHRLNHQRADDLVQDTLVRAIAKQHLWQRGTDLRAWLFTLMHHQNVNDIRRSAREGTRVDLDENSSTLAAVSDPSATLQLRDLAAGLAALPIEQRQAILLIGLEGFSYHEVATLLQIPIGTVRSRLSRGRRSLRQLLGMAECVVQPPLPAPAISASVIYPVKWHARIPNAKMALDTVRSLPRTCRTNGYVAAGTLQTGRVRRPKPWVWSTDRLSGSGKEL